MSRLGGLVSYDTDSDEEGGKAPSPLQATAQALAAPQSAQRRRLVSIDDADESVPPPPAGGPHVGTDGTDDVPMAAAAAPVAAAASSSQVDRAAAVAYACVSSSIEDADVSIPAPPVVAADRHDSRFPLLDALPPEVEEDEDTNPAFGAVVARFRAYHDATLAGHSFTASLRGKRDMGNPYILQRVIAHFGIDQYASRYPEDVFDPQALAASAATHGYVALDAAQQRHVKEEDAKARAAPAAAAAAAAAGLGGGVGPLPVPLPPGVTAASTAAGAPMAGGVPRPLPSAFTQAPGAYAYAGTGAAVTTALAPPVSAAVAAARAAASSIALSSAIAAAKQAAAAAASGGGGGRPRSKWDAPG